MDKMEFLTNLPNEEPMLKQRFLSVYSCGLISFFRRRLKLSPLERKTLIIIMMHQPISIDDLITALGGGLTHNAVAAKVFRINRKAFVISERKLILCSKSCYRINEYM